MNLTAFDEINVRICPGDERITVEERRGDIVSVKLISPGDLIDVFRASAEAKQFFDTGFLPENCLSVKIYDHKKDLAIWHPALYADITYQKTLYEHFPLPRLVFSFGYTPEGKTISYRLAVIADKTPTPKTKLYEYPFSNVYSHTGICIGAANSMPIHKSLRTLATLPNYILSLPNNDHMFNPKYNKLGLGYRELLDHLRDKPPEYYYEKVLVPRNGTLQDFIDNKIR
jgi:hypothetical protein